jgi:hypothetical protein
VSCYFRHLNNILDEAGFEVTSDNKKNIDQAIHQIMKISYKDCPNTWKALKQQILSDDQRRQDFIKKLQDAVNQN